jgi:WD40 repeat protein
MKRIIIVNLGIIIIFTLILGCNSKQATSLPNDLAQVPQSPQTPKLTNTQILVPTVTPISFQSAVENDMFREQKELDTSSIKHDRDNQQIIFISPDESQLFVENGFWNLEKQTFNQRTFSTLNSYGNNWTRSVQLENGDVAVLTTVPDTSTDAHSSAVKTSGTIQIKILQMKYLTTVSTQSVDFEFEDSIEEMSLSPDGSILAVGLHNGTLYLVDVKTNDIITSFKAHNVISEMGYKFAFRRIMFNHDGSALATSGMENIVKVWNANDFSEIAAMQGTRPVFSPDRKYLACVYDDQQILVQSLVDDSDQTFFPGHEKRTLELEFSNDSRFLISTGWYNIKVWSIEKKELVNEFLDVDGVISIALNSDNTRFYVTYYEGGIGVWGID